MAFQKIVLKTGEGRSEYVQRRLGEGADDATILAEINGPDLFTGLKPWSLAVIAAVKTRAKPAKARPAADILDPAVGPADSGADELSDEGDGVLTKAEVEAQRKRAEDALLADKRKDAKEKVYRQALEALRAEAEEALRVNPPKGDYVSITIDMPPYADRIVLDGKVFFHGHTYTVLRAAAKSMQEIQSRGWAHQEEISGQRSDFRRARDIHMSARSGAVRGAEGLRV